MSYLCQKYKKMGVTDFVSEIKHTQFSMVYKGLYLKILKVNQPRQTILIVYCGSGSVA